MCREAYLSTFFVIIFVSAAHSKGINKICPLTLGPRHIDLISPVYPSKIVRIISTIIPIGNKRMLVMESGEIELRCDGDVDSDEIKWNTTNPDQSRFYILENGNLEIKNIQPNDDGNYTCYYKLLSCEVSENDSVGHTAYYINVYEIPTVCHKISWKYLVLNCDRQLEIAYRDWLFNRILDEHLASNSSQWQLKYFKINCVEVDEPTTELQVEICMGYSFSSIRIDNIFVEFSDIGPLNEKLDNLHRNLKQFTELESYSKLEYQSYTFNMKLSWFCQSGHHIRFNVCLACPLGYYSIVPAVECLECKAGYYSDKRRSSYCLKCPKGTTSKAGATSLTHCAEPLWSTILWYVLFILPSVIAFALGVYLAKSKAAKRKRVDVVNGKEIEREVIDLADIEDKNKKSELIKDLEKKLADFKRENEFEEIQATGLSKDESKLDDYQVAPGEEIATEEAEDAPYYSVPKTVEPYYSSFPKAEPYYSSVPKTEPYYSPVPKKKPYYSPVPVPKIEPYYSSMPKTEPYYSSVPKIEPFYSSMPKTEPYYSSLPKIEPYNSLAPKTESEKESNSKINKSRVDYSAVNPESLTKKAIITDEPIYAKILKEISPSTPKTYQSEPATSAFKKPHYYSQELLELQQPSRLKKLSNTINKEIIETKQKKMLPIDENLLFE